jgi:3-deoxy-D-manno-octulosonic acid kinase
MGKSNRSVAAAVPELKRVGHRAVLFDRACVDDMFSEWFEPRYWRERGRIRGVAAGRGSAIFVEAEHETWVLRHYHRGGFMARFVDDYYVWHGLRGSRAFREWHLLAELHARGLPVPRPIAARVCRYGLSYTADIMTAYLEGTRSVDSMLHAGEVLGDAWQTIGETLRLFHDHGVDHSDLNVRNILLDEDGNVYLIDFDKGRMRGAGSWRQANLRRLQRSLRKTALETGVPYDEEVWRRLEAGYEGRAYTSG